MTDPAMTPTVAGMMVPGLETRVTRLEEKLDALKDDVGGVASDVKDVQHELSGRPSWLIAGLLSVLSSATVGLAVALLTSR